MPVAIPSRGSVLSCFFLACGLTLGLGRLEETDWLLSAALCFPSQMHCGLGLQRLASHSGPRLYGFFTVRADLPGNSLRVQDNTPQSSAPPPARRLQMSLPQWPRLLPPTGNVFILRGVLRGQRGSACLSTTWVVDMGIHSPTSTSLTSSASARSLKQMFPVKTECSFAVL